MARCSWRLSALAVCGICVASGCSDNSKPVKVRGVITLDNQPVAGAVVTFLAQGSSGRDAHGWTRADGSFELTTFSPDDGAFAGEYKVVVYYNEPESSGGEITDEAKTMQAIGKKPQKKSAKYSIPAKYSDPAKTTLRATVPPSGKLTLNLQSNAP